MPVYGYGRVSTTGQDPQLQIDALEALGCARLFIDRCSGATKSRPELDRLLRILQPGDTLAVWKLDRLGRSLPHLVGLVAGFAAGGVEFRSITEGMDTTTPAGRLLFHVMAALAEFERDLIRERTNAGLAAARAQGRTGGRPTKMTPERVLYATGAVAAGSSYRHVAGVLGVDEATVRRALAKAPPIQAVTGG